MYNLFAEFSYYAEIIFQIRFNVGKKLMSEIGFYNNLKYYYAHAYLLILKFVGVKIYLSNKISTERMIWISNHRSKLDGLMVQSLLCAHGNNVVSVIKKSISYFPIFASFGQHTKNIFIHRSKIQAEKVLENKSKKSFRKNRSILIFPEGATMSENSKSRSDKYALENNLTKLKNLLVPRTTGYDIIQKEGKFRKTGNITIRYDEPSIPEKMEHSYGSLLKFFPKVVYVDVEYSNNTTAANLNDLFIQKDKKLDQPINKNNYTTECDYSVGCLIFNFNAFLIFYYLVLSVPFFGYFTLGYTIFMFAKTLCFLVNEKNR
jgi:1-acyl-sn-glycerol-3-phosphate acyltransferase